LICFSFQKGTWLDHLKGRGKSCFLYWGRCAGRMQRERAVWEPTRHLKSPFF
jgi:hypothetical protein